MNTRQRRRMIAGVVALSLLGAACGSDQGAGTDTTAAPTSSNGTETTATPTTGGGASGEVFVTGSSTVEPITVLVAELAGENTGGALAVTVEGPGTGDGFKKFCAGEADISDASRTIKDEEAATCKAAGIDYVELAIGIDGLTVATSPDNAAITCLDVPALYSLLGPESEGFAKWSDANALAKELGSTTPTLPEADLVITGPGPESGTYDSLIEFAVKKIAKDRSKDAKIRSDYTQSPNDNVIVEGIEGSPTSLGWVGFAYYEAQKDRMKALEVDNGKGCVAPTAETIADGTYPFSRTLYMYVSKKALAENPAVKVFVDTYLSADGLAKVTEAGYVALGADKIAATQAAWTAAKG